jgi:hypothetical protein
MRKLVAGGLAAGTLLILGGGQALAAPADQGNCISNRDNGGAAGSRISSAAGPGFGPAVADAIGGGVIGSTASIPDCRRPQPGV